VGARPQYLFPTGAQFERDNLVLHARARQHRVSGFAGPLSIKTVVRGVVYWKTSGRELAVDPASFLVLNAGEEYAMDLDAPHPVETACVFFRGGFVEGLAQDATTPLEASLDNPERPAPSLPWVSRLHHDPDGRVVRTVQALAERCERELQPSGFEEAFLVVADELLRWYREVRTQMSRLPAQKASTREEVFRRLQRGREYLHSELERQVSLESAARQACLSRYHFHRTFTQAFGKTPHRYVTEVRLARAQGLLRSGRSVTETCLDVGFSSAASFSRLFRAMYGAAPSAVRKGK
jgi:AraC family transcriptional regulator